MRCCFWQSQKRAPGSCVSAATVVCSTLDAARTPAAAKPPQPQRKIIRIVACKVTGAPFACAGVFQTVMASPSYRGSPRFTRVALVQGEGDEVWRGELRLLFKAHNPVSGQLEQLALVKFFVSAGAGVQALPPSTLTHAYIQRQQQPADAANASGRSSGARGSSSAAGASGSGSAAGASGSGSAPAPRTSACGRYTGAVRLRFPAAGAAFRDRYQVMPLANLIRAEHVLTDFHRHGLSGTHEAFYVNPWKFSQENVADDAGRGELLSIAPL